MTRLELTVSLFSTLWNRSLVLLKLSKIPPAIVHKCIALNKPLKLNNKNLSIFVYFLHFVGCYVIRNQYSITSVLSTHHANGIYANSFHADCKSGIDERGSCGRFLIRAGWLNWRRWLRHENRSHRTFRWIVEFSSQLYSVDFKCVTHTVCVQS